MLILILTNFPLIGIYSDVRPEMLFRGDNQNKTVVTSSYIPHAPINIRNNSDFASQGWPGGGVPGNPYIIENLIITSDENCIAVNDTDVYFEIQNCILTSADVSTYNGILLERVSHGKIINCIAELHHCGFRFWNCSDCTAINNTGRDNSFNSFYYEESFNCTMTNNTASYSGIRFLRSTGSTLINNTSTGFDLVRCNSSTMINNTASKSGVYLFSSFNSTLVNNSVNDSYYGFEILTSSYLNFHRNIACDNNVGFYIYESHYSNITDNIAIESSHTGFRFSRSSFCRIHNNELSSRGIEIAGNSIDFLLHDIVNNTINGKELGYFKSIKNVIIDATNFGQVILVNCSSVTIMNGKFGNPVIGVKLVYCTECNLINNTVINSLEESVNTGFYLVNCNSCNLTQSVAMNYYMGFYFGNSTSLILINSLAINGFYGVLLGVESTSSILTNNLIIENEIGVYIDRNSSSNLIYLNYFANNSLTNGYDDGFSNHWDNGTHGNFWNDYNCSGSYCIPGIAGSADNHPYLYGAICPTTSTTTTITTTTTNTTELYLLQLIVLSSISIGLATVVGLVIFKFLRAKKNN